jgi:hypothetical protein
MQKRKSELKRITLEGINYSLGYKVVTMNMDSLGLRKNPNIIHFKVGEWTDLPPEKIVRGKRDYGGIWLAISSSAGNGLRMYMLKQYGAETRMFEAIVRDVLFHNSYRMKTSGIKLLEEID